MISKILNYKTSLYKILLFLGFILWAFLVYQKVQIDAFHNDELLAWNIAHDLNLYEITQLMHYEGHSFLWYMVLKPFTLLVDKIPSLFPEILKYINLTFLGIAMFLFWMKSPMNIILKILISCTAPFVMTYPQLARPYGLLILLLFIIAIQYKNRLKHPLIYSILLFLLANTCWNGLIGAMFFGLFFIYDLYKENKTNLICSKFIVPVFVICSAFIIIMIEWIPIYTPIHIRYFGTLNVFCNFFIPASNKLYSLISMIVFIPLLQLAALIHCATMKNRWFLLFGIYIFSSMFIFYLLIAPGRYHHLYFIYIYFLVIYWLLLDNSEEFTNNKLNYYSTTGIIILISLLYLFPFREKQLSFLTKYDFNKSIEIVKGIAIEGSRIYVVPDGAEMALIKLRNSYDVRTPYNYKIPSLNAYESIYQDYYVWPQDIYVGKGEIAYYLISVGYIDEFVTNSIFERNNCIGINNVYVLCTLNKKK